jgi:hypothetical protein
MILSTLGTLILNFLNGSFLSILPTANSTITTYLSDSFEFVITNFLALAYYWLPMSTVKICVATFISVYVMSMTIRLTTRIITIVSGGTLQTDKLTD